MSIVEIGCCGAYCRTCREVAGNACSGCKLGYDTGERDLSRARCAMKRCCLGRMTTAETCADCPEYETCEILQGFYAKNGHKYRKYQQATLFIRRHGYEAFLRAADTWRGAYGKLPSDGGRTG